MFKRIPMSLAALTFFSVSDSVNAVHIACTSIGCEKETAAPTKLQADTDKQPKDYFVPNFGMDHDIIASQNNLKNAEASLKHKWVVPKDSLPKLFPDGQFRYGLAEKQSVPACTSIGCEKETAAPSKLQADTDKQPKDYFVPNFGMDHDIIASQNNLKNAEASLKTKWVVPKDSLPKVFPDGQFRYGLAEKQSVPACTSIGCEKETAAPTKLQADTDKQPKDYFVPNFGMDHDIIASQNNLKNAETALKHKWVVPKDDLPKLFPDGQFRYGLVQVEEESRPACTSFQCEKETAAPNKLQADMDTHPKDYFVPNFGMEHDIIVTQSNLKNAEASLKTKWVVPKDSLPKIFPDGQFRYGLAQKQSVPACTSIGCEKETAAPSKLQADTDKQPKDYFVPNFGMDHDIIASQNNLKNAEASLKTKWVVPKDSLPKIFPDGQFRYGLAEKESVPACTSVGCEKETAAPSKLQADMDKHPKDYPVPNFGMDHDIVASESNLKNAEKSLKHKWVVPGGELPPQFPDGQFRYAFGQYESVPACTSIGCEKKTAAPIKDQDGIANQVEFKLTQL